MWQGGTFQGQASHCEDAEANLNPPASTLKYLIYVRILVGMALIRRKCHDAAELRAWFASS